jgi:mono/diheme cytochrome c family protein
VRRGPDRAGRPLIAALALLLAGPAGAEDGRRLLQRFECHRCHEGTGLPPPPLAKQCVGCHQAILRGTFAAAPDLLERWRGRLTSLRVAPSLAAIGQRLRREWVAAYLLAPRDLRPGLPATMPRLALTPAQAQALAAHLVPAASAPVAWDPGLLREGRRLLDTRGCGTCHRMSRVPPLPPSPLPVAVPPAALAEALALAPDLVHARERLQPAGLLRFLRDPRAFPGTRMPAIPLTEAEARAIAAYLMTAPLQPETAAPPPPRLPVLGRRVSFDEVNEQVLRRTCWHCHSAPDFALGDGGPGNSGGFGFPPRGLSLASYADVAAGSLDDHRRRRSLFLPLEDGTPRLLAVLLARQQEALGEEVPGLRGMPLGLPPLTPEQIQLVESWIAQGRPR